VRNPFGSEAAAFRFLLLAIPTLVAVTTVAILGGARAALLLCAATALAAAAYYGRPRQRRLLRTAPSHVGPPHERRLLVLAQTSLPDDRLEEIRRRADRVLVVSAPEVRSVRRWSSDVDGARAEARRRVDATVSRLRSMHAKADGTVGDDDPLQAIEDALRTFGGDEIVVATASDARGEAMTARIRERYALPVAHLA
jgi:GABA permease